VVALHSEDPRQAARALSELCETYWPPLYSYFRRAGRSVEDAKDLTQGVFEQVVAREDLLRADSEKGKLRSFLLTVAKRHLIGVIRRETSLKRGGMENSFSLDAAEAESRHGHQAYDDLTPEKLFDRQWAAVTLEEVQSTLANEYESRGRSEQFELFRRYLSWNEQGEQPYADASQQAGLTEPAFRAAISRMRKRFRTLLRDRIADTLLDPSEVDGEIRHLFLALS
jgi:RNA polymerase sigma-70 factor (ECF subfamily)